MSSAASTAAPSRRTPPGHSGTDFTAGQIGKVLGRSAGASALDRLTTMKRAYLTCEAPRRHQAAPGGPVPAGS